QAEDGIRDDLVTGVQTCALPIYLGCAQIIILLDSREEFWFRRPDAPNAADRRGPNWRRAVLCRGRARRRRWRRLLVSQEAAGGSASRQRLGAPFRRGEAHPCNREG